MVAINIAAIERPRQDMENPVKNPSPGFAPSPATAPTELRLARADLDEILRKRRRPTMAEIEWLLANGRDFKYRLDMTTGEEEQLRATAADMLAKARLPSRQGPTSDGFVEQTLGTFRTAWGDLSKSDVARLEEIRLQAERDIAACREHKRERCKCWTEARAALFELRGAGDKSPLGIAALAIWNGIEAFARRNIVPPPAPPPPPTPLSTQAQADITGGPVPCVWNWRYHKSPSYLENVR